MKQYEVFFALTRLEIQLWDRLDGALRSECGLPLGRFEAMRALQRLGPSRIQEISHELALTVGGTSKLIDRIEASGFCTRTPNPDDRRSSIVALTPEAMDVIERAEAVVDRALHGVLDEVFDARELDRFGRELHRLREVASGTSAAQSERGA